MLQLNFYIEEGKKFTQQIINQEHILQKLGE
jgi:ribosomal protein S19